MLRDAWLVLESGERCDCAVSDISDRGARINVHDIDAIPDSFVLLLAENGAARRECRVIWRKPREVGVKFDTWLDARIRATQIKPGVSANAASKMAEAAESET
jgi:PilZ domain